MTTPRNTKRQRLERAGWRYVSGWLPADEAQDVAVMLKKREPVAEKIGASGPRRRGRPRKDEGVTE